MPFLAKLDLKGEEDARKSRRFLANRLDGLIIGKDQRFDIIIHNISETGFLAEFHSELQYGDMVRLQLARIGFVDARVVRKRGLGHGCEFVEPIPADIIQETIASSIGLSQATGERQHDQLTDEDAERSGLRRRARRERIGALIVISCMLLAIMLLAGAIIRVFSA